MTAEALARGLARRLPVRARIRDRGQQLIVIPTRTDRPDTPDQANARAKLAEAYSDPLTGLCPATLGRGADGQREVRLWARGGGRLGGE